MFNTQDVTVDPRAQADFTNLLASQDRDTRVQTAMEWGLLNNLSSGSQADVDFYRIPGTKLFRTPRQLSVGWNVVLFFDATQIPRGWKISVLHAVRVMGQPQLDAEQKIAETRL